MGFLKALVCLFAIVMSSTPPAFAVQCHKWGTCECVGSSDPNVQLLDESSPIAAARAPICPIGERYTCECLDPVKPYVADPDAERRWDIRRGVLDS